MKEKNKKNIAHFALKIQMPLVMIFSVVFALLVWSLIINQWVKHIYWPSFSLMLQALVQLKKTILTHLGTSVYRTLLGYIAGCTLGILIGYGMSWNKWFNAFITPYVEVLRPIPALALIPFFILWFGIGDLGKILMIAMGTSVVMIIITLEGIHQVNPVYLKAASVLGASKRSVYKTIVFPASLPSIMGGLRVNAASAFGLMIASEFLGAKSGLGFLIIISRRTMKTEVMLLSVIIIGVLSFLFDRFILVIGRHVTRWMPEK